jgi:hypothetical protein
MRGPRQLLFLLLLSRCFAHKCKEKGQCSPEWTCSRSSASQRKGSLDDPYFSRRQNSASNLFYSLHQQKKPFCRHMLFHPLPYLLLRRSDRERQRDRARKKMALALASFSPDSHNARKFEAVSSGDELPTSLSHVEARETTYRCLMPTQSWFPINTLTLDLFSDDFFVRVYKSS